MGITIGTGEDFYPTRPPPVLANKGDGKSMESVFDKKKIVVAVQPARDLPHRSY